jgi:hypothetical protein
MAYQTYHCSDVFCFSVCLITFLHTSLALSVLPLFMFYAPCPFTTQFLFCVIQLLHSPPSLHMNHLHQKQPQQLPPTTTTSSLLCNVYIYSFCAYCACNIFHSYACSYRTNLLHLSSALHDHHRNSSGFLAIFPRVQHHWMLC